MRLAVTVLIALACAPAFAKGKLAAGPATAHSGAATVAGGHHRMPQDPRGAPALDPKRTVSEQDCSRPVDLSAGNLKCK